MKREFPWFYDFVNPRFEEFEVDAFRLDGDFVTGT